MGFFSAARQARTTLPCPDCGQALDTRRTCRKEFPLTPFIPRMDEAMETFLEQLFVDRV